MAPVAKKSQRDRGLVVIAIIKFFHVAILIALMVGLVKLLNKDVADVITRQLEKLRLDPDNRFLAAGLTKLNLVHDRQLKELGGLSLFYALLFSVEGVGLLLGKRWAEWLTVVATGLFIPLEIYELVRKATALKVGFLVVNVAIVAYLVWRILGTREKRA